MIRAATMCAMRDWFNSIAIVLQCTAESVNKVSVNPEQADT